MCAPTKRITPRLRRRGGCPHPPADHGECSLNVRAGEDTGPYGICGNLFKYRRGGSQTRPRAHTARPYEEYGGFPVYRKGRGLPLPPMAGNLPQTNGPMRTWGPKAWCVGAAHLGRPRDTFISRPGAGRPYPRSSSAAPPGRAPPSPPAWGPPPRGPGPAASR